MKSRSRIDFRSRMGSRGGRAWIRCGGDGIRFRVLRGIHNLYRVQNRKKTTNSSNSLSVYEDETVLQAFKLMRQKGVGRGTNG